MGYDVHITRKTEWSDDDGPRISESEWLAYVASDSEMVITGVAEHTNPKGETIRIQQPLLTKWHRHSGGAPVWFSYFEGSLAVKNPDDECLAKMRQIAGNLQARVQGDDGEGMATRPPVLFMAVAQAGFVRPHPTSREFQGSNRIGNLGWSAQ